MKSCLWRFVPWCSKITLGCSKKKALRCYKVKKLECKNVVLLKIKSRLTSQSALGHKLDIA
jgi:hypothetical protein